MYVKRVTLKNVKCFSDFTLEFPDPPTGERSGGWYVIVGPNGMGKSTILRAIALCLLGERWADRIIGDAQRWAREQGSGHSELAVSLIPDGAHRLEDRGGYQLGLRVRGDHFQQYALEAGKPPRTRVLAAGYGAFRRVGGRQIDPDRRPLPSAFASLFDDDYALDATRWLVDADYRRRTGQMEHREAYGDLISAVVRVLEEGRVLPGGVRMMRPSPAGIRFVDSTGAEVGVEDLSDGYRSTVGLVLALLRSLVEWQSAENSDASGSLPDDAPPPSEALATATFVLIDEPDAHLHPSWQREIGFALQRVFPNIQFIVATHSPFICQAASPGGIFQLRLNPETKQVEAVQPVEGTVQGWHIEDIYDRALGVDYWLDVPTQELRERYDELEGARVRGELNDQAIAELARLEAELHATLHPPGRTKEERERFALLDQLIQQAKAAGNEGAAGG